MANSAAVVTLSFPPHRVAIMFTPIIVDGMVMSIVPIEKNSPTSGFIPLTNMW